MSYPHPPAETVVGPGRRLWPRRPAFWLLGVYALAAWTLLLALPEAPPTNTADAAWRAVLHHAAAHGWQAGTDVVFTYGPLGYLQLARQYHAETAIACIVYQLLCKAFYVGLLVRFARRLPRGAAAAFLLANTLLPLLDEDSIYLLTIGYGGLVLQGGTRTDRLWSPAVLVFLATAALMKETFLVYGVLTLTCAAASLCAAGRKGAGALVLGGFGACFFTAYLWLAGQNLSNLPTFLRTGWEIVGGYPAAMALRPPDPAFVAGCVLLLGLAGWRLGRAAFLPAGETWTRNGAIFLMLCAGLFLVWKAGFTRADPGHCMIFFSYVVALDTALPVFFSNRARSPVWAAYVVPLLAGWIVCMYALWDSKELTPLTQQVEANGRWLLSPGRQRARLDALARAAVAGHTRPRCRAAVGEATVDLFGCGQTALLDHGYNYRPPPVFQPYSAYTAGLIDLNAAFYRSERAPEFVLFKPEVMDNRFPTLENAVVLRWLLRCYRPVLVEQDALLLRRRTAVPDDSGIQPLADRELTAGTELTVPPTDGAIWCEMDWQPNELGRLVGLVFQPPYCELDVSAPGQSTPTTYRVVPAMARAGFLLDPTAATPGGFLRVLANGGRSQGPETIKIHPSGWFRWLMQPVVRCRLYEVPPFAPPDGSAAALP